MGTSFRHPRRKIALAREHIKILNDAEWSFMPQGSFKNVVDTDQSTGMLHHKVRLEKTVPDEIFDAVDSAIGALRSSLDKACYATSKSPNPKLAYFPIANTEADLERQISNRCGDLDPAILDLIRTFKPYKGGNEYVWPVNRLANTDKHKCIEPYVVRVGETESEFATITGGPFRITSRWNSTAQEYTYLIAHPSVSVQGRMRWNSFIALCEIDELSGVRAVNFLAEAAEDFERILGRIEEEATRLNLICPLNGQSEADTE